MRSVLEMNPPVETETIVTGVKTATAINHLRENRIEYLLLLGISHLMGFTSIFIEKAQGVCY